jgi:hypothetical protein
MTGAAGPRTAEALRQYHRARCPHCPSPAPSRESRPPPLQDVELIQAPTEIRVPAAALESSPIPVADRVRHADLAGGAHPAPLSTLLPRVQRRYTGHRASTRSCPARALRYISRATSGNHGSCPESWPTPVGRSAHFRPSGLDLCGLVLAPCLLGRAGTGRQDPASPSLCLAGCVAAPHVIASL